MLRGLVAPWLDAPDFRRSHQSALVRKAPAFYRETEGVS
ncbi:hypothetical protein J2Z77_000636 [Streptomyces avidinii]|uniref:Uncharacterized protein n=1 Tax=Streptomyces avidinii TaxID=1895 RepID=A0ABS4KXT2_STRAV|nr:hypothetical protein [Streptomyces avidinii]